MKASFSLFFGGSSSKRHAVPQLTTPLNSLVVAVFISKLQPHSSQTLSINFLSLLILFLLKLCSSKNCFIYLISLLQRLDPNCGLSRPILRLSSAVLYPKRRRQPQKFHAVIYRKSFLHFSWFCNLQKIFFSSLVPYSASRSPSSIPKHRRPPQKKNDAAIIICILQFAICIWNM